MLKTLDFYRFILLSLSVDNAENITTIHTMRIKNILKSNLFLKIN